MSKNKTQKQAQLTTGNYEANIDLIFELSQNDLHDYLKKVFILNGKKVISTDEFLYVPGTLPVLLVCHLDTVHKDLPTVCKSRDGEFMMAPQGIGGDDRAGVWINMEVLKTHDCHILFTHDEETGGGGATAFTRSKIMPKVNFIIEADRQGDNDAVFYDCGNVSFAELVTEATGYKETFGTFSDISIIAPYMDRAAVNLSSGYFRPHTNSEYVRVSDMKKTVDAIGRLVTDERSNSAYAYDAVIYTYKSKYAGSRWWEKYDDYDDDEYWNGGKNFMKGAPAPATTLPTSGTVPKLTTGAVPPATTAPVQKPKPVDKVPFEDEEEEQFDELELDEDYMMQECRLLIYKLTSYWVGAIVVEDVAQAVREVLEDYWAYPIRL